MKSSIKRLTLAAGFLSLALAAAMGYQALGIAQLAGQPTAVVTVNLGQVMEKLDQWSDAAARLRKLKDELTAEQNRRQSEMEKMKNDGAKLQEEINRAADARQKESLEARMQALQEEAAMAALDFQAWMAFSSEKADIEAALATHDLYRSIKSAVAQMATTLRFDVVLVDDSQGELSVGADSRVSRVDQIRQQVAGRRMLYANPTIDITDDLIQRMNNARKQVGAKAP